MEPFVADASVGVAWCVAAQSTRETSALLGDLGEGREFFVPGLWLLELSNSLVVLHRRGKLSGHELTVARRVVQELDWIQDDEGIGSAFSRLSDLALKYGLSTYDAAYLELAQRRGVALASRDALLNKAAARCGVKTLL